MPIMFMNASPGMLPSALSRRPGCKTCSGGVVYGAPGRSETHGRSAKLPTSAWDVKGESPGNSATPSHENSAHLENAAMRLAEKRASSARLKKRADPCPAAARGTALPIVL